MCRRVEIFGSIADQTDHNIDTALGFPEHGGKYRLFDFVIMRLRPVG